MNLISAYFYAATAVLYALVSLLSVTSWNGRRIGGLLIAACIASCFWALVLALQEVGAPVNGLVVFVAESLRIGLWISFLAIVVGRLGESRLLQIWTHAFWISYVLGFIGMWFLQAYTKTTLDLQQISAFGGLMLALIGLVLIEQLFRNADDAGRWAVKPLVIGLGGAFAYDLFLYGQATQFHGVDQVVWQARGAVNILLVPLIAIAVRRNPSWDLDIFLSRQVVFYSSTLVAVGIYLLLMSLGGYAIVLYGGNWGGLAQIVFFVGAVIVLVVLLFSAPLRARFHVLLSKHFFRNKFEYREEWLRLIATLSGIDQGSTKQVVIQALAQIMNSPSGSLWIRDASAREYRFSASHGEATELPGIGFDEPLIRFVNKHHWLVDLVEYVANPEIYENISLPDWLKKDETAWLIVPLVFRNEVAGLVLLRKASGALSLNYEDRDLLKTVGHHVAVHLAQENADNLLAEAQQFEAYNRLTAFLMHDLNNLIAQQSLIVANADKHKRNPDFIDDAMQTIAGSVDRMKSIMAQLKGRDSEAARKQTQIRFLVSNAVDSCAGRQPQVELSLAADDASIAVDTERFMMVLSHLIRNAQDATPPDGFVRVEARTSETEYRIRISDSGSGMSPEFVRDRLFKPFDSTKGSQGMGIGAYQAREFVRSIGGDLRVVSEPGKGTTFTMILPCDREHPGK